MEKDPHRECHGETLDHLVPKRDGANQLTWKGSGMRKASTCSIIAHMEAKRQEQSLETSEGKRDTARILNASMLSLNSGGGVQTFPSM